jgi:hypothetical protein
VAETVLGQGAGVLGHVTAGVPFHALGTFIPPTYIRVAFFLDVTIFIQP